MISNRQLKLLIDLESADEYVTGTSLSTKHGVSLRTIQNDIAEIKTIINDLKFVTIESVPSKGTKLIVQDRLQWNLFLDEQVKRNQTHAFDTREERIRKIIALLFSLKKGISVQHIADRLFVSKSTLMNDLKDVKNILEKYELTICNKPYYGLYVKGEEYNIRACIIKENINVYYAFNEFMVMGQISEHLPKIRDVVVNALTEFEYRISDVALQNLIVHIDIMIRRIEGGFYLESDYNEEFMNELIQEKEISEMIFDACSRMFQIKKISSEIQRLSVYLRGKADYEDDSYITQEIDTFVYDALVNIKKKFRIDFTDNVQLRISLSLHLIPLLIRLKYNMQLNNELVNEVQKSYQLAFDIASSFSYDIQKKYNHRLAEGEIAYFAIYFNNALSNQRDNTGKTRLLIISSLKRSETLLLRERINFWFSNIISELIIKGSYEVKESDFQGDVVVCVTEENKAYKQYDAILINQFPNQNDFLKIKMSLDGFRSKEEILDIFSKDAFCSGKFKDKSGLINKLGNLILAKETDQIPLVEEVIKREAMGGTYYGNKVSMPHPMHPVTSQTHVGVAILNQDMEWDDNQNQVRLVLLVSMEKDNPKVFQLWSYLSEFINNEELVSKVISDGTFDTFIRSFSKAIDKVEFELREY